MENVKQTKKYDGPTKACSIVENSIENYMSRGISMMLLYSGAKMRPKKVACLMSGKSGTIESRRMFVRQIRHLFCWCCRKNAVVAGEGKSIFTAREQGFVWVEGSKQRAGFLRLFVLLI